ncbi:PcfJ domain-containing protein [Thermincola ferriacetica]
MPLIAEVIIPQMFTAYAEDLGYLDNGLHHFQYFCKECDQIFASAWGKIPGTLAYYERGNFFYCPYCGKKHDKNVVCIKQKDPAPDKIRLAVKEYKDVVTFEIFSKTVEFKDYLKLYKGSYKEIFRFDISRQTVLFFKADNESEREAFEIGNPVDVSIFEKSILQSFQPYSLANSYQKKELNRILKVLRETVHRKLEKRLGHKIASMYVSPGQYHGTFLLPILNIAYRVLCPDAPNLPSIYRETRRNIMSFWKMKMISDHSYMDDVIAMRRKKSFVPAMVAANLLPDTPFVRRVISENPFDVVLLTKAFKLCSNYDYAIRLFEGLRKLGDVSSPPNKNLIKFLHVMKVLYGEVGIVRLVENHREVQIWDCVRLYQQLNKENRKALKTESVKLRNLHDWLSLRHQKQEHVNLKFDVPKHIVKRLSMQKDRLKFFLPKESMQLLEAGHELHNCVASYGPAMKDNKKWIVLVADDKGKLAACLEIRGKELVQAKVDRNKPVSTDPKLNAEVVDWAQKAGLKINTSDVSVPIKKATSRAV